MAPTYGISFSRLFARQRMRRSDPPPRFARIAGAGDNGGSGSRASAPTFRGNDAPASPPPPSRQLRREPATPCPRHRKTPTPRPPNPPCLPPHPCLPGCQPHTTPPAPPWLPPHLPRPPPPRAPP